MAVCLCWWRLYRGYHGVISRQTQVGTHSCKFRLLTRLVSPIRDASVLRLSSHRFIARYCTKGLRLYPRNATSLMTFNVSCTDTYYCRSTSAETHRGFIYLKQIAYLLMCAHHFKLICNNAVDDRHRWYRNRVSVQPTSKQHFGCSRIFLYNSFLLRRAFQVSYLTLIACQEDLLVPTQNAF